jgi:hypothetical protein
MPNTIIVIEPSNKTNKKYTATVNGTKHIDFGAKGYSDFTQTKNIDKTNAYIARHSKSGENWKNQG